MSEKKPTTIKDIYPIILITIIVTVAMVLLALVNTVTEPLIDEHLEEKTKESLQALFPEMDNYESVEEIEGLYLIKNGTGGIIGYGYDAKGKGYGGDILLLVGVENDTTTIRGISIIDQKETAGLGALMVEPEFTDQFKGEDIGTLALKKDGGNIDAITGATISSSAVIDAIKDSAVETVRKYVAEGGG